MDRLRTIPGGMLVAFVIGLVDSLIVWGLSAPFDVDILVPESPGSDALVPITVLPIVVTVAVVTIAAGLLLWVLERFVRRRALAVFQVVALIALLLSLGAPLMLDQSGGGKFALIAMHLLVGSAIIGTFTWVGTAPRRLRVEQPAED